MMGFNLPATSFGVVLSYCRTQHLPQEDHVFVIFQVAGWLRPGGHVLFNFPAEANENIIDRMPRWVDEKGWVYHSVGQ